MFRLTAKVIWFGAEYPAGTVVRHLPNTLPYNDARMLVVQTVDGSGMFDVLPEYVEAV